ncbi:hypothetical protein ABPG75_006112 [Micractinium tetrahymenae]
MALGEQPAPVTPAPLPPADSWVADACRVCLDSEGNVLTHIPALLAAAVDALVRASAASDAAMLFVGVVRRLEPTRLHGCRPPGISIEAYAERLLRYCKCSPVCYLAAFCYMSRLQRGHGGVRGPPVRVDALTAHRMMAVGTVVATKFYDDKYYSNEHYAQVAGVSLAEFNAIELDFLFRLDFRARCALPELAAGLHDMQALASGHSVAGPAPAAPALPPLSAAEVEEAAAAAAAACAPAAAGSGCHGAAPVPVPAAAAALVACRDSAAEGAEGEDSCSDATTVAALCPCPAYGGCEEDGPAARAAPAPLPWASTAAAAAVAAAEEAEDAALRTAPPRRSKKRCSMEAQHVLYGGAEERPRLAEPDCCA